MGVVVVVGGGGVVVGVVVVAVAVVGVTMGLGCQWALGRGWGVCVEFVDPTLSLFFCFLVWSGVVLRSGSRSEVVLSFPFFFCLCCALFLCVPFHAPAYLLLILCLPTLLFFSPSFSSIFSPYPTAHISCYPCTIHSLLPQKSCTHARI